MAGFSITVLSSCGKTTVLKESPAVNLLKANESFRVVLPEDHTKGYTWVLDNAYDASVCKHENTVWHGPDKGVYFEFKALKTGTLNLKFLSRMYTDTADIKVFSIKIHSS